MAYTCRDAINRVSTGNNTNRSPRLGAAIHGVIMFEINKTYFGDCRHTMRDMIAAGVRVQTCVTSPPYYGLRDYEREGQIGLEETPTEYVNNLVSVFTEVKQLLNDDGTLWLNLGDSYAGSGKGINPNGKQGTNAGALFDSPTSGFVPEGLKPKDLMGIPWRVAFALQDDGWYLRQFSIVPTKQNADRRGATV